MGIRKFDVETGVLHPNTAKLLSIASARYEDDWISVPHTHSYTEIFYVKSGHGKMLIEDKSIPLLPDMLVIINAHTQHTETSSPSEPIEYYVIGVEGIQVTSIHSSEYTVIESADKCLSILPCFDNILEEMHAKEEGYLEISQNYLAILLRKIYRNQNVSLKPTSKNISTKNGSHECHKAKQYIDANFSKKITLETLAKISNINKYYLSHCFTEIYGKSPIAYLNQVRVTACTDLLVNTNHTIEDIAASTGFSSRSYLAQVFQKTYGMTCQQYRKLYRK